MARLDKWRSGVREIKEGMTGWIGEWGKGDRRG